MNKPKIRQINGYKWYDFSYGVHSFSKIVDKGVWSVIQCSESQLNDGTIEIMTKKQLTLNNNKVNKIKQIYRKVHNE